jgi:diguanylate cyclase (GGDEF)-like protein
MAGDQIADTEKHFSGINTRIVVQYLKDQSGPETLRRVLDQAGDRRTEAELLDDSGWCSYTQLRNLFEATSHILGGEHWLATAAIDTPIDSESGAEMAQTLQNIGSPASLLRVVVDSDTAFGVSTIRVTEGEEVGPAEWAVRERFKDGFAPFKEFCAFTAGMLAMLPKLFGLPAGDVVEESCCCDGAQFCSYRLRWYPQSDETRQRNYFETRSHLLEARLETLQRTVANLVSAEDPTQGLTGILDAAARAMYAPSYVLATDPSMPVKQRLLFKGLEAHEAEQIGRDLSDQCGKDVPGRLVVQVASNRIRYGWLAAIDGGSRRFQPQEREVIRSYAGLAASALDSATALEEARRQATTASTLLGLSSSLADLLSTEQMAMHLAAAVPSVIDCDRCLVLVNEPGQDECRVVATHGYPEPIAMQLDGVSLPNVVDADQYDDVIYHNLTNTGQCRERFGPTIDDGALASASVRMMTNGELIGDLVVSVTDSPDRLRECPPLSDALRGLAAQVAVAIRNARLVDEMRHQALHDGLTGLPNRTLMLDRVEQALARARRENSAVAAMFIDLDGFKDINDTLGHAVGDQLLSALAGRLKVTLRQIDSIGRLGGDEFVAIFEGQSLDAGSEVVAERILQVVQEPFDLDATDGMRLSITASIGVAVGDRASAGELLRDADIALYRAKAAGKNCYAVYVPEMSTAARDRLEIEMDLHHALAENQFFVLYQPIFDLQDCRVTGVEALLRWRHPSKGTIMPDDFIPLLESSGAIVEAGRWVLEQACRQGSVWRQSGHALDISVNVSPRQLEQDRFVSDVAAALERTELDPTSLVLEITETTIMRDAEATIRRLKAIKTLGVRVAVDDFGTGYSSLAYLSQFPVDALKIDRSFLSGIMDNSDASALVHTLVQLGKTLGLATIAEGIEDVHQFSKLQMEHCDSGQGFLLARPLEVEAVDALLGVHDRT